MAGQLPFARSATLQPGGIVPHSLVNEIQDGEIALARGAKLPQWVKVSHSAGEGDTVNFGPDGQVLFQAGSASRNIDLPVMVGDRIRTIRVDVNRDAGDALTVELRRRISGASATVIDSAVIGAGVDQVVELDIVAAVPAVGLLVVESALYFLRFDKTGASAVTAINMIEINIDGIGST